MNVFINYYIIGVCGGGNPQLSCCEEQTGNVSIVLFVGKTLARSPRYYVSLYVSHDIGDGNNGSLCHMISG